MSKLSCDETPLAWPPSVALSDIKVTNASGIKIRSAIPGTLRATTRRHGGVGDGVNIAEDSGITVDYRGQTYVYKEAIFHSPGLHRFPGQGDIYPAEYHLHMHTGSAPERDITIVIPLKMISAENRGTDNYFRYVGKEGNKPTIMSLITFDADTLNFQAPDVRGRTAANPTTANCSNNSENQFILVLTPGFISAADITRIQDSTIPPGSGLLGDKPAPRIAPTVTTVDPYKIKKNVVLARPGIINPNPPPTRETLPDCKPPKDTWPPIVTQDTTEIAQGIANLLFALGLAIGLYLTDDWFIGPFLWSNLFTGELVKAWNPLKVMFYIGIVLASMYLYSYVIRATTPPLPTGPLKQNDKRCYINKQKIGVESNRSRIITEAECASVNGVFENEYCIVDLNTIDNGTPVSYGSILYNFACSTSADKSNFKNNYIVQDGTIVPKPVSPFVKNDPRCSKNGKKIGTKKTEGDYTFMSYTEEECKSMEDTIWSQEEQRCSVDYTNMPDNTQLTLVSALPSFACSDVVNPYENANVAQVIQGRLA